MILSLFNMDAIYVPLNFVNQYEFSMNCIKDLCIPWILCTLEQRNAYFPHLPFQSVINSQVILIQWNDSCTSNENTYSLPIAYIIHTSGTTRQGRGAQVAVPMSSFIHNLQHLSKDLQIIPFKRMILLSEITFDPSLVEIGLALCSTSTLYIVSSLVIRQSRVLFERIVEYGIDLLMLTPSLFLSFDKHHIHQIMSGLTSVTDVVLGGERFPEQILQFPRNQVVFWNIYGTTECSIWSTLYRISPSVSHGPIPLGNPIGNTLLFIQNDATQGELWMGGEDRVCFVNNEVLLFRPTGDIVQRDENGQLFYIGRIDSQIKIHGYRVDLNQISNLITTAFPRLLFCLVKHLVTEDLDYLVAFLQIPQDQDLLEITRVCKSKLPFYAVPYLCPIKNIPLTHHGKVDSKVLEQVFIHSFSSTNKYSNALKGKLDLFHHIVSEFTNENVDLNGYFLTQGGSSLSSVPLVHQLIQSFSSDHSTRKNIILQTLLNQPLYKTWDLLNSNNEISEKESLGIEKHVKWKVCMGKCIDSTPILELSKDNLNDKIYIGSHSGLFLCINAQNGHEYWRQRLPDRIEATATLYKDRIYIGCFDFHLYVLCALSGHIVYKFKTGGEIKARVSVDTLTGKVWIGSYDETVYCLRINSESLDLLFGKECNGYIRACGALDEDKRKIYIPTSRGNLYALNIDSYETVWSIDFNHPLFSNPLIHSETGDVFIGCTDTFLYRIDGESGSILWKVCTDGPIFSSPCFFKDCILVGSHSKRLFQIQLCGRVLQEWEFDSPLFASPCVFKDSFCCVSILGQLMLRSIDCTRMIQMPGEIFSSPSILDENIIVVGSRNDWLYCINL